MSELYDLSLDELLKGDATLLNKIERDMKVAKAENNIIKFAWISIVIGVVMIILGNVFDVLPPHARDFSRELGGFLLEF